MSAPPPSILVAQMRWLREGVGNGRYQEVELLHAFETYAFKNCGFRRECTLRTGTYMPQK